MEETDITEDKQKPWLFKKGQSGNPNGRPKGTFSLKTYAKKYLQEMTDEEKLDFMEGLPKDVIWKMAEGNPKQDTELEHKGEVTFAWKTSLPSTTLPEIGQESSTKQ